MRTSAALAIAIFSTVATLALPSAFGQGGPAGCVAVDLAKFNEVQPVGALAGYPGWTLATGLTFDRWPPTPTAVALGPANAACDLTHGLATFLGPAASPASPADAVATALLAIHAQYLDVFPSPALAKDVGLDASSPVVTKVANGYAVDLTAWTARNGVVARFHVVLDGAIDAHFLVTSVAKGPAYWVSEGWLLPNGATDAVFGPIAEASQSTFANADGSSWRVTYNPASYTSAAEAATYVAMTGRFAQEVYASETTPWGLASGDPDRVMDITLDGCDCIYGSFDVNVHLFPRPNDILPLVPGLSYPDTEENVGGLILGHEFFHHLEYSINQWRSGGWEVEGMARFSETVHAPATDFGPGTLLFRTDANGLNNYILHPNAGLNRAYGYEVSLLWGWLYHHEGGMALIKAELEESRTGGTNPDVDGVNAINRAIARTGPHEHATFAESLDALVASLVTHQGWTWGKIDGSSPRDWSTFFSAIPRDPLTGQGSNGFREAAVQLNGMECVNTRVGASGNLLVSAYTDVDTKAHLLSKVGGTWSGQNASPAALSQGASDTVTCLSRARTGATSTLPALPIGAGTYLLTSAAP